MDFSPQMRYNCSIKRIPRTADNSRGLSQRSNPMTTPNDTSNIPYGYCQCGCGQKTKIADKNNTKNRCVKGEPRRFVNQHQRRHMVKQPIADRFWEKVDVSSDNDECWEWNAGRDGGGYGCFTIQNNASGRISTRSHRMAYELTYGVFPRELDVLHKCDNPPCCNPAHLFLGTDKDNSDDKVSKNRQAKGEQMGQARLTTAQVQFIRSRYLSGGISTRALAAEMGVGSTTVWQVVSNRTWKHLPSKPEELK
jgi:hypothetical protein